MERSSAIVFPNVGTSVLSATIHLVGVTVLAHLISRRTALRGTSTLRDVSWPWICVLLIFIDSWLFIFSSGILILGSGLERNDVSCSMGILLCIIFYGSSKMLIYAFLSERVHVVWRPSPQSRRLQCKAYVACVAALSGYLGVVAALFYGRISDLVGDEHVVCYIGLKKPASITLLTYDFFVNAFLTGMFLWPVVRSSFRNTRVQRLAIRTLWSALIALTTSCVNILILTLMHGRQLGWVCLGSCGTDVIVNALVMYWVTSRYSDHHDVTPTAPGLGSPSKTEDPEQTPTEPQRGSKFLFQLGRSRQNSPVEVKSMQITVTTERIEENGEVSIDESEYELQKVHSVLRKGSSEIREENPPPNSHS
ncbi:hypothetical protein BJ322DRAFT_1030207 [Thelephora terrestris]|uniref:Transmembrane protein n=1 Tax=Thelephora terrestris TaxID=56493 RepID=A0A9P6HQD5_9AGAM|nr:hypothetical protein BJ322DRAFT_1030207 [Thelephora terrestris]